jgi:PAS domain S-box-containing protein
MHIKERNQAEEKTNLAYQELNQVFQTAADGMRIIDRNFTILRINDTFATLAGIEKKEVTGEKCYEVFPSYHCHTEMCSLKRILSGEEHIEFESIRERIGGTRIPCIVTATPFRNPAGAIIGIVEDFKDITERKQAEETLRDSEEKLDAMLRSIGDHMSMLDRDLNIIWANDVAKKIFGDDIIGKKCYTAYHKRDRPCEPYPCLTLKAFADGKVHEHETSVIDKNGKIVYFHCTTNVALRDKDGNPTAVIEVSRDITKRKEAEEALRRSEEEKRIILDSMSERLSYRDLNMKIIWANRPFIEATGLPPEEVKGRHCYEILQKRSEPCPECPMHVKIVGTGESQEAELETPDGKIWAVRGHPVRDTSGNLIGTIEISTDITEKKKAQKEIEKLKRQIEFILGVTKTGLDIIDSEFNIMYVDPEWQKVYGNYKGKKCYEYFMNRKEVCPNCGIPKALKTKTVTVTEEILVKEGNRPIQVTTIPFQDEDGRWMVAEVNVDITERKKMEEERLRVQKLESLGILAGGIAHDFNNILTAIVGNVTFARMLLRADDEAYKALAMAERASKRAKDLTQQLLAFSRGGEPIKKLLSVSGLLKDAALFVLSGSSVKCEFFLNDDLLPVEADEGQINQVINNLLINAMQSMPQGGTIRVYAQNVTIKYEEIIALKEGKYVKIIIEDEGHGIPEEYITKIFDPYFTTKQKGSGLGLTTAFYIIKKHNGDIEVRSKLGAGTTFTIYLPASERPIPITKEDMEIPPIAKGKVLVMDDEEILREFTCRILTRIGYEVETARDGTEAIEMYKRAKESGKPFDVILLDLTIPGGMGGKEAMRKLLEIDPHIKAIVSSGYSNDPIMAKYREFGFKYVVSKPYTLNELSKALHNVLTRSS